MAFRCVRCHAEIERTFKACPHCGEPVTDFLRRYADEPVDGKYRIIERLGAGGMGEVYKVEHAFLRATRVIKVIKPQISEDADAHERFLREAQLATKIQHPNVATLHDFSALTDGSHYTVWEFIEGEKVAHLIRSRGVLDPAYAIRLAVQTLNGLDAVHRALGEAAQSVGRRNPREGDLLRARLVRPGGHRRSQQFGNCLCGGLRGHEQHVAFRQQRRIVDGHQRQRRGPALDLDQRVLAATALGQARRTAPEPRRTPSSKNF